VKFRGVISLRKLLPIWAMPKGTRTRVLSSTFFEVDEDALGGFRAEEGASSSPPRAPTIGLEHEVEFPRLGQRAERLGVGAQDRRELGHGHGGERNQFALPVQIVGVLGAEVEELEGLLLGLLDALGAAGLGGHEDPLPLGLDPAALHLVEAGSGARLAAIDM